MSRVSTETQGSLFGHPVQWVKNLVWAFLYFIKVVDLEAYYCPDLFFFDEFSKIKVVLAERSLIQQNFLKWAGKFDF